MRLATLCIGLEELRSSRRKARLTYKYLKLVSMVHNLCKRFIRTDNGTEFVNQVLTKFYEKIGIFHQKSVPRTPQQNGVVERRNRTLVEAARTMLIFSKDPMFLWVEAVVATACYTKNRSLIHTRHNKTPYELVHDKKLGLVILRVFGALCYPTNDSEDLEKLQPIADIGIFVGYAPSRKGYRIYNKRTRRIIKTIHVQFDELSEPMAPVQLDTGPAPSFLMPGQISSGLVPNPVPTAPYVPLTNKEMEILFQPMFDEYIEPLRVEKPVSPATASSSELQPHVSHQGVAARSTIIEDNPFAHTDNDPFVNVFAPEPCSEASSSRDASSAESTHVTQSHNLPNYNLMSHIKVLQLGKRLRGSGLMKQLSQLSTLQFWDTLMFEAKTRDYHFQLDEDWFRLDENLLRKYLEITPVDQVHQFVSPPLGDAIMDFVNQLGYPGEIYFVSRMAECTILHAYLEMVAKHERRIVAVKGGKKKTTLKADKPMKPAPTKQAKPATAKQPKLKPVKEKSTKPTPLQKADKGKVMKAREEYDLERAIQMSLESFQAQGQAHVDGVAIREPTVVLDEGQDGSDPGKTHESRPPPDNDKIDEEQAGSDPEKSHVALAGPNPEPMHDDFVATIFPKVHESLKFSNDEQVILEDPQSSSGTLSSMKNLDDTYTLMDQFFNDKSTEDEPGKQNVDVEVVSMVTVLIHQASTSVPPLSTPIIDLSPPKPAASPLPEPLTAATTLITTTTLRPPQHQSTTDLELAARVTALKKKFFDFEQKSQNLDKANQNLRYRVYTL
nr:hypothetical protein [Tanacetum cinerariifolium]